MLLTSHITLGAALSSGITNPAHQWLALTGSIISYYLLDCVPHYHLDTQKRSIKIFIKILDIIGAIIGSVLFSIYLPYFTNKNNLSNPALYPFDMSTVSLNIFGQNIQFSIFVLACCILAMLPGLIKYIEYFLGRAPKLFTFNGITEKYFHRTDKGWMGKLVHFATPLVFTLYSFRLLPNSENQMFVDVILLMLIIIAILAIIEAFTDNKKP